MHTFPQFTRSMGNYFRGNFIGRGQFSGGWGGGQLSSRAIFRGLIIQGAIIRGAIFLAGNCPRPPPPLPQTLKLTEIDQTI